jgi:hypothetical protein
MEVIESKKEEVVEKVIEQIENRKDDISKKVDETEVKVEETVEKVSKKLEETVSSVVDKLDDNPQVAKVIDSVENIIIDQLDNRDLSCSCFGFLWSLRITRKSPQKTPSKSEESQNKSKPQPTLSIRTPV